MLGLPGSEVSGSHSLRTSCDTSQRKTPLQGRGEGPPRFPSGRENAGLRPRRMLGRREPRLGDSLPPSGNDHGRTCDLSPSSSRRSDEADAQISSRSNEVSEVGILHESPVARAGRPDSGESRPCQRRGVSPCDETREVAPRTRLERLRQRRPKPGRSYDGRRAESPDERFTGTRRNDAAPSRFAPARPTGPGPSTPARMRCEADGEQGLTRRPSAQIEATRRTGPILRLAAPSRTRRPGRQQAALDERRSRLSRFQPP